MTKRRAPMGTGGGRLNLNQALDRRKRAAGSVLVEGVAGVLLVVLALFALLAFLVDGGIAIFYKSRLGFVTDRAAWYVARHYRSWDWSHSLALSDSNLLASATPYINDLLARSGLPAARSIRITTDSGPRVVLVSIELEGIRLGSFGTLPLCGNLNLPAVIALKDQSAAMIVNNEPPSIAVIAPDNGTFPAAYAPIPFIDIRVLLPDYGDSSRVNTGSFVGGPYSTFSISTLTLAAGNNYSPGPVIDF